MGRKTGKEPDATDGFLMRICHALDETPRELAKSIGVKYKELEPLLGVRCTLVEMDMDEVWWSVKDYVAMKLGYLLAINGELNKALQADRTKRINRTERFKRFHNE